MRGVFLAPLRKFLRLDFFDILCRLFMISSLIFLPDAECAALDSHPLPAFRVLVSEVAFVAPSFRYFSHVL